MEQEKTTFTQPNILKRIACLLFGHKFLYDGYIKDRQTPTLQNYIYAETETHYKNVGLGFCPRCYAFTGIHFLQEKPIVEPIVEEPKKKDLKPLKVTKPLMNKKKKKK